jgi:hypothetical protein
MVNRLTDDAAFGDLPVRMPTQREESGTVRDSRGVISFCQSVYKSDSMLLFAAIAFMVVCYGVLIAISWRILYWANPLNLTFNSMLAHLLHGRFDVDPEIIGFEGFLRGGRVYSYFGIWCALLRFPLWIVHKMNFDMTAWSILLAVCIAGAAKVKTLLLVRRKAGTSRVAAYAILLMLIYILLGGSEIGYLNATIYQEVVMWAAAFGAIFVYFAIQGVIGGSFSDSALRWMALCAGLSLVNRVSSGIGLILAFVLLLLVLAAKPGGPETSGGSAAIARIGKTLLSRRVLFPLGILAAAMIVTGLVNYYRWGNPTTFANYYLYICNKCIGNWVPRLREYGMFNVRRIPFALMYYFFPVWILRGSDGQFLLINTQTRLFNTVALPPGTFFLTDLLPLCFIVVLAAALWKRRAGKMPIVQCGAVAIGLLTPWILMFMASSTAYRYRMEFYPEIDFLAFLGLYLAVTDQTVLAGFSTFRRWMTLGLAVSVIFSFFTLMLYDIGATEATERDAPAGIVGFYRQAVTYNIHRLSSHHPSSSP